MKDSLFKGPIFWIWPTSIEECDFHLGCAVDGSSSARDVPFLPHVLSLMVIYPRHFPFVFSATKNSRLDSGGSNSSSEGGTAAGDGMGTARDSSRDEKRADGFTLEFLEEHAPAERGRP